MLISARFGITFKTIPIYVAAKNLTQNGEVFCLALNFSPKADPNSGFLVVVA